MVAVEALSKQINELKAKQAAGTLTREEAALLSELEQQYAEALEQASAEELQEIADGASSEEAELVSLPDIGFVTPAAGLGAAALAGGGGGGGGAVAQSLTSSPIGGSLINGYTQNAFIFQDTNNNGVYDVGEPNDTTNANGEFELTGSVSGAGPIIATPTELTVDTSTGLPVTTTYKTNSNSDNVVISPLSTLVAAGVDEASLKAALGLDANIVLEQFDPIEAALDADASAAQVTAALNTKVANTQIAVLLKNAEAFATAAAGVGANSASDAAALTSLASAVNSALSNGALNLGANNLAQSTLTSAVAELSGSAASAEQVAIAVAVSEQISNANTAIQNAVAADPVTSLKQIGLLANVAQSTLTEAVAAVSSGSEPAATSYEDSLLLVSSDDPSNDAATQFAGVDTFGNGATFNFSNAVDPNGVFERVALITSGEGYAAGVNVAFAAFTAVGSGFAAGSDGFSAKVASTPNGRLEVKLIFGGDDSVANIELDTYAGSTNLGNGWYDVVIPFSDFSNPTNIPNHSGYLIGMPNDNGPEGFEFYFTDVSLVNINESPLAFSIEDTANETVIESNLVANSSFDTNSGWFGNAANAQDGVNYANVETVAANSYDVNLSYGLELQAGSSYTLTFRARGAEGRKLIAGIGLNEAPYTALTEEINLTEEWTTFSFEYADIDFGSANSRVLFDMGHDTGEVVIDDVSLIGPAPSYELIDNTTIPDGYGLVFEENFDNVGAQPGSNWTYDLGNDGWGNNESQDYQADADDAVIVDIDPTDGVNGALRITAQQSDGAITSARVKSQIDGLEPYGYYEIRAKLPSEQGAWPAIWLLGQGGRSTWPNEGEIDLVEWSSAQHDESAGNQIISALHFADRHAGTAVVESATLDTAVDDWHIYQLWWTPESIKIGVDGAEANAHLVYEKPANATDSSWPFDEPMDLILNIAIGGTLGGEVPAADFEYAMEVDYVRIYQNPDDYVDATLVTFDGEDVITTDLQDFGGAVSSFASDNNVWYGNAFNPVDGVNMANVEVAGNPWDVNLSGAVELTAGQSYTLTFEAKGTEGRTILAGLGDVGAPYAADTVELTLGADWQTYTLHLDSTGFTSASRVLFDMGADVGAVDIDNVSVVAGHIGTEALNEPTSEPVNLVLDGTFSATDTNASGWSGNAYNPVDGVNKADIAAAGNPWDVNLSGAVELTAGQSYTLTFEAKGTEGRTILAGLGDVGAPYAADTVELTLGADWQTYTLHLDSTGFTGASRVLFDMGADVGAVDIDNVSVVAGHIGTEALNEPTSEPVNLVLDGAFSASDTTASGWGGNAYNPVDGVNKADIEAAGNPWDVNLSGAVELAAGQSYTLTFEAKGTEGRTILAGLGDAGAPYASDTVELTLGADWQTYTLHLDSTGFTGASRVLFDMGADVGAVDIDNVSVVAGHIGTEALNEPTSEPVNLVLDGAFSASDTTASGWSGNAYNPVDGVNKADIEAAGNPWDVNLSGAVELAAGQSYTLTFEAKGTEGRTILAGLGDAGAPYASDTVELTLGADWQTYTLHLDSTGFTGPSRVLFDMGADVGAVDIDNVSVVAGHIGTEALNEPTSEPVNLVLDGTFSATDTNASGWSGNAYNPVEGVNKADIAAAGNPWDVNLSGAVELTAGQSYTLTFEAKGTEGRTILAGLGDAGAPYASDTVELTLGADWQTYTLHLDSTGFTSASRVLFDMGADVGAVDIDNVSVVAGHIGTEALNEPTSEPVNLVLDGTFSATDTNASGWSGNAYNPVEGVNKADIAAAGNPWDVNLSGAVELTAGQSYTLTFEAKGTEGRTILAGLGDVGAPYAADTVELTLGADWQTYTLHLDSTGFTGASRVLFDMGADVGAVDIDNVSVVAGHIGNEVLNQPAVETINLLSDGDFNIAPEGSDGTVVQILKSVGADQYAGTTFVDLSGEGELISEGSELVTMDVWAETEAVTVLLKLENSGDSSQFVELLATTSSEAAETWETLAFNFAEAAGLNHDNIYDKASVFFEPGSVGDGSTYLFDNVDFEGYIA